MQYLNKTVAKMTTVSKSEGPGLYRMAECADNVVAAAKEHLATTHITSMHSDGSAGRHVVRWEPSEQRYSDGGNNFWLYRREGDDDRVVWFIEARNSTNDPVVTAMCEQSRQIGKYPLNLHRLWSMYHAMIFLDMTEYHAPTESYDLHVNPFVDPMAEKV